MNYQDIISPYYINTVSSSQVLGIAQNIVQSRVVQRPVSNNPGLRFNLSFFVSFFKNLFQIIFSILFRASKHQIVDKKNYTEYSFKAFIPEVRFHTKPRLSPHSFEQPSLGDHQLIHHKILNTNSFRNVGRQLRKFSSMMQIYILNKTAPLYVVHI